MTKLTPQDIISIYLHPKKALNLTPQQWQVFIWVARKELMLARFQYLFETAGIFSQLPDYAQHHLTNAKIIAEKQDSQVFYEAHQLLNCVGFESQYKVFLKGAGYTLSGQSAGAGRVYSDIDLLVEKNALAEAEQALSLNGWTSEPLTDYDTQYYRQWTHEIPPLRHPTRGTLLDLHHNILPPISGRAPKISVLLNEVITTERGFQVLSPPAMCLHSMIHLFFNEEINHGFRDLADLDLIIRQNGSEDFWQALLQLSKQTQFNDILAIAVYFLSEILQTPIPNQVLTKFKLSAHKIFYYRRFLPTILSPSHRLLDQQNTAMAKNLVMLRGHWLKMPLHVLLYHTSAKAIRSGVEFVFGKSFFLPDDPNHKEF